MDIRVERDAGTVRLRVAGELDLSTADEFRGAGRRALDEAGCQRLVIDMSGVEFMDSVGVGVLVDLRNRALPRELPMILDVPSERVLEVLRLTAMDGVFDIAPPSGVR